MSHIKTYLERKSIQLKQILHRHYEHPMFITWIFTIIAVVCALKNLYIQTIVSLGFAIFYWIYCDYRTGEDIGWKRQQLKDRVLRTVNNANFVNDEKVRKGR